MKFLSGFLNRIGYIHIPDQQRSNKNSSLESKQTGSCGGMSSTELKIRLELILGDLNSTAPIIESAIELAKLSHPTQSFFLTHLTSISEMSSKHAYQLLTVSTSALKGMEQDQCEQWLEDIKQLLVDENDQAASNLILNFNIYSENDNNDNTVNLKSITEILNKLIISLHKVQLPIVPSSKDTDFTYTDSQQFYLPKTISNFDSYSDNYKLYKIKLFHLIGQLHCHTWQAIDALQEGIKTHGSDYLKLFSKIETLRIDQAIKQEFPGIWRDIVSLHNKTAIVYPENFFKNVDYTSVNSSLHLCNILIEQTDDLPSIVYQPNFFPDKIKSNAKRNRTADILIMNQLDSINDQVIDEKKTTDRIFLRKDPSSMEQQQNIISTEKNRSLWEKLPVQNTADSSEDDSKLIIKDQENNVYYYNEWDTSLQKYRNDWCRVKEISVESLPQNISEQTDHSMKYAEYKIRKIFDLLINDQKLMRYQNEGDEIDIDAWITARSNINKSADNYQQLYIRNNKNTRDVAIMFSVDISGSTSGWKNTVIKQSTGLLCEVLSKLNDQYAVYAFSGSGRDSCRIYPIKSFTEPYSKLIKQRIFSMQPQQYTRMGASIRHLSKVLSKTSAKTKILFILTDGKPDDIDSYRGHYGIEDTRRAIQEAKALALNPFVLTFDKDGLDYLPHMLGSNSYQLISDISELPVQISTIYKHLTA